MSLHAFLQAAPELSTKLIRDSDKFEAPQHHASSCLLKRTTCEPAGNVNMFCNGKHKQKLNGIWLTVLGVLLAGVVTVADMSQVAPAHMPYLVSRVYFLLHTVVLLLHCCMHRRPEDLPPNLLKMSSLGLHCCVGPVSLHREKERVYFCT